MEKSADPSRRRACELTAAILQSIQSTRHPNPSNQPGIQIHSSNQVSKLPASQSASQQARQPARQWAAGRSKLLGGACTRARLCRLPWLNVLAPLRATRRVHSLVSDILSISCLGISYLYPKVYPLISWRYIRICPGGISGYIQGISFEWYIQGISFEWSGFELALDWL